MSEEQINIYNDYEVEKFNLTQNYIEKDKNLKKSKKDKNKNKA